MAREITDKNSFYELKLMKSIYYRYKQFYEINSHLEERFQNEIVILIGNDAIVHNGKIFCDEAHLLFFLPEHSIILLVKKCIDSNKVEIYEYRETDYKSKSIKKLIYSARRHKDELNIWLNRL